MIHRLQVPGPISDVEEVRVLQWHGEPGRAFAPDELIVEVETHKAVATPHRLQIENDMPSRGGVYNLGFLGVRAGPATDRMLRWWEDRLRNHCSADPMRGYFTDQKAKVFQDLKSVGRALGMPTSVLVDAQGCEIGTIAGPAEWASEDALKLIKAAMKPVAAGL